MKAFILRRPAPVEDNPLQYVNKFDPECKPNEIRLRISACGVCHTDLHVVEGDLDLPMLPVIPGHQIVGEVIETGADANRFRKGDRVGIAWLNNACGICDACSRGYENLCREARFTGYHVHGGFAGQTTIDERFAYRLPDSYDDAHVSPLLCAGIVGYRSLKVAGVAPGERVGLYGFGASAHLAIQVLKHWNCEVYVFSRTRTHLELAEDLGADWIGKAGIRPPRPLHRAIIYAPAGWIMVEALKDVGPGGVVASAGIHMSDIPEFPYGLLYGERKLCSVANATRQDGEEFLKIASEVNLKTEVEEFPFEEANRVLQLLKTSGLKAAGVLRINSNNHD